MKVIISDSAALRSLGPLEVAGYLRAKGWRQEADLDGRGNVWLFNTASGGEYDVILPSRRELADYSLRMSEVMQALAEVENRSPLEVIKDVQTSLADLIRIRAPTREAENGTLPFDLAVNFVERSRDMLLAAACAALDKRAVFAKRKAQQAMDYLSHVRMGQTERGSYVLTILSPVPPELQNTQASLLPIEPEAPYERVVTRTLMTSLKSLETASRQAALHGNMRSFQDAVNDGVSANLCDAIVGLSAISPREGLDISVSWSRTRQIEEAVPTRIVFDSDSIPLIQEASRQFRETAPTDDYEISGSVTRLNRGTEATEGEITITANVDGQIRAISLMLDGDLYRLAIQAHDDRRIVCCVGELVKEGRGYRLNNPRHFQILAPVEN